MYLPRTLATLSVAVWVTCSTLRCTAEGTSAPATPASGFQHRGFYLQRMLEVQLPLRGAVLAAGGL